MSWSELLIVYLVVGIVAAECGMKAVLREGKDYPAGAYVISVTMWPLLVVLAGSSMLVDKLMGRW